MADMLLNKFRGCLTGALLGDCFGAPFEYESIVSLGQLQKYFDKLEGPPFKTPLYKYTDDTAMTKCVAESLIENADFNAKDMALKFVTEYLSEPHRGYGKNVIDVFHKLNQQKFEDVWAPARDQFGGTGSYGNGGAMRIAPCALFYYKSFDDTVAHAKKITQITHTHPLGVNGALLQVMAVRLCLLKNSQVVMDPIDFMEELNAKFSNVEKQVDVVREKITYADRLQCLKKLLVKGDEVTSEMAAENLGNDVSAPFSVPTAIYCFLRASKPISKIQTNNPFRRTLQFAISLGGDTDTIASMAGALAGAYYGSDGINENLRLLAEDHKKIDKLAGDIFKIASSK